MARTAAERLRIYGPPERVRWVQERGCALCGRLAENAHTASGGLSRKAGYQTIVGLWPEHHRELHNNGSRTFEARYGVDLKALADLTEAAWQEKSRGVV